MLPAEERLDPRIKRTRGLLEQAFMDVLTEKGFRSVSVQDITEKAGLNRATFYAHFPDKYALLDHSIRTRFQQELEKRTLNVCTFSMGNLRALIITVCEFISTAGSHCNPPSRQFESLMEAQVKIQIRELVQNWVQKLDTKVDARVVSTAASWAVYGLALQWSHEKKRTPAGKFADGVLPLLSTILGVKEPV